MAEARALITGINGFVGSHLAEYLLAHTDWQICGTVYGRLDNIASIREQLTLFPAELSREQVVDYVLEETRPDYIFHLAAQPIPSVSRANPWFTLENNIRLQLNILEGVVRLGLTPRVLVVGSSEEYGAVQPEDLPIDEETPLRPLNAYGLSKIAQDFMGLQYFLSHRLPIIRVRPFNHIGPRQRPGFVAADFARQIAAVEAGLQEPVVSVGNLDVSRDFSDVRDVVRAYHGLMLRGEPGEVYNVGSGTAHSVRELLELLLGLSDRPIEVRQDPAKVRPADVPCLVCDATKLRKAIQWEPRIPFAQSLRDVLDYWREQVVREAAEPERKHPGG
ncbi:MAG: GDP-mannose 4,6-dehydratase [Anaerolineae bacterium]|nr:GDP-mannose 4,6-dehydratase [Anaerolineae bacterium]